MTRLMHPKLMDTLQRDFFVQTCALKKPTKSQNTTGQETVIYTVRPGYEAIPCRVGQASGGERRTTEMNYLEATHTIVLSGQFQDLTTEWQASVDSKDYDILLLTADPDGVMTKLLVRIVQ